MKLVNPIDKLMILSQINEQIEKGNIDFAKKLKDDALEYLKKEEFEFEWLGE